MEILDNRKGTRTIQTVSSTKLFYSLRDQIAETLNAYPQSVNLQYRFSTETKALPCDLTSQQQFQALIVRLKPLVVPPVLSNGRRSARVMKPVAVQVFNRDDGDPAVKGDGKVNLIFASHQQELNYLDRDRKPQHLLNRSPPKRRSPYHRKRNNTLQNDTLFVRGSPIISSAMYTAFLTNRLSVGRTLSTVHAIRSQKTT
jgi:hypothetical protein